MAEPALRSHGKVFAAWSIALILALWAGASHTGGDAIILLAFALPLVMGLSPAARAPSFPGWVLATFCGATALWMAGEGRSTGEIVWPSAIAALAGLAYMRSPTGFMVALAVQVLLVAFFSGGKGSGGSMVEWFRHHGLTEEGAKSVTYAFRKTVHFSFYGSVGWVALRAARGAGATPAVALRTGLLAALSLAAFDELRQSGYGSRTGSAWDVLLDLSGAATFVGLSEVRRRRAR